MNGTCSKFSPLLSGVPQGSVLGPVLFLIYINDLEKDIKSTVKFFADDTMLFSVVKNPNLSADDLNHDLGLITNWAYQWKMSFNPDSTKQAVEIVFSHKTKLVYHPPLYFNNILVSRVNDHKHIGMILEKKLNFSKHVNDKINKTKKSIGLLKYLSSYLPLDSLCQIYKLFIQPHLD